MIHPDPTTTNAGCTIECPTGGVVVVSWAGWTQSRTYRASDLLDVRGNWSVPLPGATFTGGLPPFRMTHAEMMATAARMRGRQ